tara:strand:+ start:68 stop:544 length:477 start_codon:yes stop_codon:yes gene_type:complete
MGLAKDIENAFIEGLGVDVNESGRGKVPDMAKSISDAIINFLQEQTFTITELKSAVELEEIKTVSSLSANVLSSVTTTVNGGSTGTGTLVNATGVVKSGTKGVLIPAINLRKKGSIQGGQLTARGYAYIGKNPISSREKRDDHGQNKVKLLEIKRGTE